MSTVPQTTVLNRAKLVIYYTWWERFLIAIRIFFQWFYSWHRLNFTVQHQQQTNWCWDAVTVSIILFYDPSSTWTQCTLANEEFGQTDCCEHGDSANCNQTNYTCDVINRRGHLDRSVASAATFDEVMTEINNNRPIAARIRWSGGGGHAIVVEGYRPSDQFIGVEDPWYGTWDGTYDSITGGTYQGSGTWWATCFTKA